MSEKKERMKSIEERKRDQEFEERKKQWRASLPPIPQHPTSNTPPPMGRSNQQPDHSYEAGVAAERERLTESVTIPNIDYWFRADQLPVNGATVMAYITVNGLKRVCQVTFHGNEFFHEWRLGNSAVNVDRWLPLRII